MMEVSDKYKINDAGVFGTGTWAVVKECFPINGYIPAPYKNKNSSSPSSSASIPRLVAKVIDKQKLKEIVKNEENGQAIVQRELTILETLPPHPGVVRFIECIESDSNYFLIFEAAIHGDLCELLLQSPTQRVEESTAQKYVVEMVQGLLHCHRHNVVHRDVKPENILVAEGNVIKIADFGLAKTSNGGPAMNVMTGVVGAATNNVSSSASSPSTNNEPFSSNTSPSSPPIFNSVEANAAHTSSAISNTNSQNILHFLHPSRIFPKGSSLQTVQIEHRLRKASGKGPNAVPSSASLASSLDVPIVPSMLPPSPTCQGHEIMGTFRYGAPEMFEAKFSNTSFDAFHADTWSLGVVTFIMLTGTFPFSAGSNADERQTWKVLRESQLALPTSREQGGETSAEACDFLGKLLEKDPQRRMKLWDALDHPWLSSEVRRQQSLARDSFVVPAKVKSFSDVAAASSSGSGRDSNPHVISIFADSSSPQFVSACQQLYPLSPALEHMRKMVLANTSDENLKNLYNQMVLDHYQKMDALCRLRQSVAFGLPEMMRGQHQHHHSSNSMMVDENNTNTNTNHHHSTRPGPNTSASNRAQTPNSAGMRGTTTSTPHRGTTPRMTMRGVSPLRPGQSSATTSSQQQQSPSTGRLSQQNRSGSGGMTTNGSTTTGGGATRTTHASPISRYGAGATRRATPTPGARSGVTPSSRTTPTPSTATRSTAVRGTSPSTTTTGRNNAGTPTTATRRASPTPTTRGSLTGRGTTVTSARGNTAGSSTTTTTTTTINASVGDAVSYKSAKAVVRFAGPTKFAPGMWLGLELVDGDGLHDGTSSIDKKRYFQCPAGKGVFVRPSQIAKLEE